MCENFNTISQKMTELFTFEVGHQLTFPNHIRPFLFNIIV